MRTPGGAGAMQRYSPAPQPPQQGGRTAPCGERTASTDVGAPQGMPAGMCGGMPAPGGVPVGRATGRGPACISMPGSHWCLFPGLVLSEVTQGAVLRVIYGRAPIRGPGAGARAWRRATGPQGRPRQEEEDTWWCMKRKNLSGQLVIHKMSQNGAFLRPRKGPHCARRRRSPSG